MFRPKLKNILPPPTPKTELGRGYILFPKKGTALNYKMDH